MKRRICLVGTAIAVVPFAVGISVAAAAGKSTTQKPTVKPVMLKCHMSLSTVPQPGSAAVDQPPSQGSQYGTIHCGGASFGFGVEKNSFKVPDSGDTVGSYVQYFGDGSVRGKFDLTPDQNGDVSSTDFTSESWTGTVTVTKGSGTLAKASGKQGVLKCTSGDSVHLTCTEKLKLKQL
ncbi:MAG TPA: hypothetical protein VFH80_06340 [Solirubrobacteraceae bacterium]|nr:hypothetical protein [Solirubrobacteraceae bacterium]